MRMATLMALTVFWLCLEFSRHGQSMRPGSEPELRFSLPAITQSELDAAFAERRERIRREGLPFMDRRPM